VTWARHVARKEINTKFQSKGLQGRENKLKSLVYISLILELFINIKRMSGCELNLSDSGLCPVSGSCEYDNKISDSIQYGEFD
jgi:hypothetical protein